MDTNLNNDFATIIADNNIQNLGSWKRWKALNKDLAETFRDLADAYFETADLFEESSKRGRTFNFYSYDEFKALLKDNGLTTLPKYRDWRNKQNASVKARLPYNPQDVYTVAKSN